MSDTAELFNLLTCRDFKLWAESNKIHPSYFEFLPGDTKWKLRSSFLSENVKPKNVCRGVVIAVFVLFVSAGTIAMTIFSSTSYSKFMRGAGSEGFPTQAVAAKDESEQKIVQLSEALSVLVAVVKKHQVALMIPDSRAYKQLDASRQTIPVLSPSSLRKEDSVITAAVPITVNVSNARLRIAPTDSSDIITTLERGTDLLAMKVEKGWVLVTAPTGQEAWIRKNLISVKTMN